MRQSPVINEENIQNSESEVFKVSIHCDNGKFITTLCKINLVLLICIKTCWDNQHSNVEDRSDVLFPFSSLLPLLSLNTEEFQQLHRIGTQCNV